MDREIGAGAAPEGPEGDREAAARREQARRRALLESMTGEKAGDEPIQLLNG
jgi:hypothetical protein